MQFKVGDIVKIKTSGATAEILESKVSILSDREVCRIGRPNDHQPYWFFASELELKTPAEQKVVYNTRESDIVSSPILTEGHQPHPSLVKPQRRLRWHSTEGQITLWELSELQLKKGD